MRERKTCGFSANAKGSRKAGDTSSKRIALLDNSQVITHVCAVSTHLGLVVCSVCSQHSRDNVCHEFRLFTAWTCLPKLLLAAMCGGVLAFSLHHHGNHLLCLGLGIGTPRRQPCLLILSCATQTVSFGNPFFFYGPSNLYGSNPFFPCSSIGVHFSVTFILQRPGSVVVWHGLAERGV